MAPTSFESKLFRNSLRPLILQLLTFHSSLFLSLSIYKVFNCIYTKNKYIIILYICIDNTVNEHVYMYLFLLLPFAYILIRILLVLIRLHVCLAVFNSDTEFHFACTLICSWLLTSLLHCIYICMYACINKPRGFFLCTESLIRYLVFDGNDGFIAATRYYICVCSYVRVYAHIYRDNSNN